MAGAASRSISDRAFTCGVSVCLAALILLLITGASASAQSLYKYRGENGEWIYSDRPPGDGSIVEVRRIDPPVSDTKVSVTYEFVGRTVELVANNQLHAPVELKLVIEQIRGLKYPHPDDALRWVLPPRSRTVLVSLDLLENATAPVLDYRTEYLVGEPGAVHLPLVAYRVPFAIASNFPVSQAFPNVVTHKSPDSYYAVDLVMPVGTDIFAARDGIVFDVASENFRSGLDIARDGPAANVIRVLHDDGTYAIYAHLNWNSIRVRPGDRVQRGEYIADSGNTGFSSGPHLHFAVLRNAGMRIESLPVTFAGPTTNGVTPATGTPLTAY